MQHELTFRGIEATMNAIDDKNYEEIEHFYDIEYGEHAEDEL